jgi:2',3'-cyclic-nucleotide 2'-phosphodiesterase (5'-nucleotidase family)
MLERDGVRTAVIGIATSGDAGGRDGRPRGTLEFGDEARRSTATRARCARPGRRLRGGHDARRRGLRGAGPRAEEESRGCRGHMIEIAQRLREPVDLIVGGHTHQRVMTPSTASR